MQIFFLAPSAVTPSHGSHIWQAVPGSLQIGSVEFTKGDGEQIAKDLEAQGILVLSDHRFGVTLPPAAVTALASYGVTSADTTATAMAKVFAVSGYLPHKAKRFQ